jgi:hypothetical protein
MKRRQVGLVVLAAVLWAGQAAWAATVRYRSVGPGNSAPLVSGSATNSLSVQGATATLTLSAPAAMGVGDVIQYDSNNDGAVDTLAFVSGRNSATSFMVTTADGSAAPTAVTSTTNWAAYRAYTSLANVAACTENSGLAAALQDFDPATTGVDLVSANAVLYVACYADNPDTATVNWPATWTTDSTHYIRIYTPRLSSEVGTSQRHLGVLGAGYLLSMADKTLMGLHTDCVRLEGLQLETTSVTGGDNCVYFYGTAGDYQVSDCIFHGDPAGTGSWNLGLEMESGVGAGTLRVWNNLFYDFHNTYGSSMEVANSQFTVYFYNNTVVNCNYGILANGGSVTVKNTIVQNCVNYYYGTFTTVSDYNLSGSSDAPGANSQQSATVAFAAAGSDFHLAPTDLAAHGHGTDLSADANLAFTDDVDCKPRALPWDIGADQLIAGTYSPTFTPTVTPTFTFTRTPTPTSSVTKTCTATPLPGSPTFTPTISATGSITRTATPTPTRSATRTLTATISPTCTVTLTNPPSATVTLTSTVSPTPTLTSTFTPRITSSPVPFSPASGQVISYPSPGKGSDMWFTFQAEATGQAALNIYNLTGEKVTTLSQAIGAPGQVRLHWDIHNVASGVYFYQLQTEQETGKKT